MLVRGGTLDTGAIWDDTDIVHVVQTKSPCPTTHLRRLAAAKQPGRKPGREARSGHRRLHGQRHSVGQYRPNWRHAAKSSAPRAIPWCSRRWHDSTVGAGLTPGDQPDNQTLNGDTKAPLPGDWNTVKFDEYANDANFAVVNEQESAYTGGQGTNNVPNTAENLGDAAPIRRAAMITSGSAMKLTASSVRRHQRRRRL